MGIITSPPEASYANFTKYVLSNTCLSAVSPALLQAGEVLHEEAPVLWPASLHPAKGLPKNIQVNPRKYLIALNKIFACTAGHGAAARGCLPVRRCDALRGERQHARQQGGQLPVYRAVNEISWKISLHLKNHYLLQGRGRCGAGAAGAQLQLRHGLQGVHGSQRRRGGCGMLFFWTSRILLYFCLSLFSSLILSIEIAHLHIC